MSRFEDRDSQGDRPRSGFGGNRSGGNRNGGSRFGGNRSGGFGGNRSGGSRFGGNRSGGSRFGGNRSGGFGNRPPRRFNDGPREMHKAVCSDCGKECEVPFKPTEGKPVYCNDCFKNHKKF